MHISDFSYNLPESAIAIHPVKTRGTSRLLVLNRQTGVIKHDLYNNLVDYVQPGDVIVLNNTKVIKARLIGASGDKIREFLLLERHAHTIDTHHWKVLYRGKIRADEQFKVGASTITVEDVISDGIATISSSDDLLRLSEAHGTVPLPPYLHRDATKDDIKRYQTEFASVSGSVAAPTASLNFTSKLHQACEAKGALIVYLTLHVGLGTFLPIRTDKIENHKMHSEYFEIPINTVEAIKEAKNRGNRIVAIGTTVTRTLEYAHKQIFATEPEAVSGEADNFIYPGYQFKVVDALLTNFHAPKTTVLMMATTFANWENLSNAYQTALNSDYKFLSYGDSMLII